MNGIGQRLREAREKRKLTQEQVASCLSVKPQTISGYEREKSQPDILTIRQLADLYRVSIDDLLDIPIKLSIELTGLSQLQANNIIRTVASFVQDENIPTKNPRNSGGHNKEYI